RSRQSGRYGPALDARPARRRFVVRRAATQLAGPLASRRVEPAVRRRVGGGGPAGRVAARTAAGAGQWPDGDGSDRGARARSTWVAGWGRHVRVRDRAAAG